MFKAEFDQPTYADLRLVLRSSQSGSFSNSDLASDGPPAKRLCTGLSLDDVRSFYTHKLVLASSSPVIKAMLMRAKEFRELQAMGDGLSIRLLPVECKGAVCLFVTSPALQLMDRQPEILELPVEQDELLACEVLCRSMYSGNLAEEVASALSGEQGLDVNRAMLLVQVYRLADRLEVCTDQCAEAISALSSEDCESVKAVNYVFSLKRAAPALVEHATIQVLMERCLSHQIQRFRIVRRLLRSRSMVEFQRLDFLTVLALFDSDELEVMSENEVLALMGAWMGEDWANLISKEQLGAFWNVLRLGDLTTSFITKLNVVAPWLPVDPAVLSDAAAWKIYQVSNPVKAASLQRRLQSVYGSSVAWFRDKRDHQEDNKRRKFLKLVPKEDLTKLLTSVQQSQKGQRARRSQRAKHTIRNEIRFNGYDFWITLFVQLVSDGSKKTFVISVGFVVRTSGFLHRKRSPMVQLVHVKASCVLGDKGFLLGVVDDFVPVHRAHVWEVARVDALDDFSCLGSYLDKDGNLPVLLRIAEID